MNFDTHKHKLNFYVNERQKVCAANATKRSETHVPNFRRIKCLIKLNYLFANDADVNCFFSNTKLVANLNKFIISNNRRLLAIVSCAFDHRRKL